MVTSNTSASFVSVIDKSIKVMLNEINSFFKGESAKLMNKLNQGKNTDGI